jgi:hypothetical protein
MTFPRWLTVAALVSPAVAALALTGPAAQAAAHAGYRLPAGVADPCAAPASGHATCAALAATAQGGGPLGRRGALGHGIRPDASPPPGFSPANLRSAYSLPDSTSLGDGETVAVVTAYDDPDAASDLATYRSEYSLPACTAASGCFTKVNQTGGTTYPGTSAGWSAAVAQSLDMISAVCPQCHLLLVEANSTAITDLGTAENEAVTLGASFVDNDWFTPESTLGASEPSYDTEYFDHPGVAITGPAGNSGYGVNYPAASPDVTAVGGTTLTTDSGVTRGYNETAWSGSGSGCSEYEAKPAWQTDTGCSDRTLNDTAAVADPNTPIAYYDTPTAGGWGEGGGTDVSAAIVAAAYALAGTPAPGSNPASYLYQHPDALYAITSGSNGTCSPAYLCTAGAGYNGPTGMGTPSGATAYAATGPAPAAVVGTNNTSWVFTHGTDGSIEADSLPSGSSTWSGLTSLGGDFSGYPGALAGRGGYIWVVAVSGGDLEYDNLPSGSSTWSGWTNLGNGGTAFIGTPQIIQDASGNEHIFVRDSAGALYTAVEDSGSTTWSSWSSLGGTWPDDVVVDVGGGGWMNVLAIGLTTDLYQNDLPPGGSWAGWKSIATGLNGVPAVMIDQAGSTSGEWRVFARATTGALETTTEPSGSSTWSKLSSLGGSWQDNPQAYPGSGGTDWLYMVGDTTDLYYNKLSSGTWGGWTSLGSGFAGLPGASQDSEANELFGYKLSGGDLEQNHINNGSTSWAGFTNLGGPIAGT